MKRLASVAAVLVLLAAGLVASGLSANERGSAAPLSAQAPAELPQVMLSDLVIEPSDEHENAYSCRATILDARTGETLARPQVLFLSGQDARLRSGVELDGERAEVDVVVSADAEERTATVRVELTRAGQGEASAVQQLRVRL